MTGWPVDEFPLRATTRQSVRVDVEQLVAEQGGVVARWQALMNGLSEPEVDARLRSGAWVHVHEDVYADHPAPWSWHSRAWAGVLTAWPAALSHESALRAAEGPGRRGRDDSVIHVAIAKGRKGVPSPTGVVVHAIHKNDPRVAWETSPPRMRYEEAIVDLTHDAATDEEALAILADTCGGRPALAALVVAALARRTVHPRRALVKRTLMPQLV